MFREAGKVTGNSMVVVSDDIQVQAMKEAGFVDVQVITHKVPMGSWPRDTKLSQIGAFAKMSLESDLTGYSQLIWHEILRWPTDEFEVFMMKVRKELKDKNLHPYFQVRYVWGRKPEEAEANPAEPVDAEAAPST